MVRFAARGKPTSVTVSRRNVLQGAFALGAIAPTHLKAAPPETLALKRGINTWPWFALTREYPAPRTDYAWPPFEPDRPVPSRADLAALRRAGFDFVRIPVDPGPFLAAAGGQRTALVANLLGAATEAIAAGLAVVVNIQANAATHYWTPDRLYGSREAPAFASYRALVGEVAGHLGRLGPSRIALEPVNEPPQGCTSDDWQGLQIALIETARQAAPSLTLVATGGCGSMIDGLLGLDPAPLLAYAPLLFTFHFYEPYLFSHQGAPWMTEPVYKALNAVPWPASAGSLDKTLAAVRARMAQDTSTTPDSKRSAYAETERVLKVYFDAQPDRPYIDGYLGKVQSWCTGHGIAPLRVLLGEFGALGTGGQTIAAPRADRIRYIRDVRLSAESFGFPWAMWDLFSGMGVMDDVTHALDPAILDALGLTMPRD